MKSESDLVLQSPYGSFLFAGETAYASPEEGEPAMDLPDQYAEDFDSHSNRRNSSLGRLDKLAGNLLWPP